MNLPLSTPDELASDPELAALEILGSTAGIARTALFAAYPELISCGDFFIEETDVAPRQCLAVAVVTALDSLIDSIEHYRGHLDNLASHRGVSQADADDIPF
jgi:hypothetical protein